MELGYILARPYWQNNLAVEGIQALKEYGFRELGFPRLVSLISRRKQRLNTHRRKDRHAIRTRR